MSQTKHSRRERNREHNDVVQELHTLHDRATGALRSAISAAIEVGEQGIRPELTDRAYAALKPGQTLTDPLRRGLVMRCGSVAGKYWVFRTTDVPMTRRQVEVPMGDYPRVSVAEARALWADLRRLRREGDTPLTEIINGKRRAIPAARLLGAEGGTTMTMRALVDKYLAEYAETKKRASSAKEDARLLYKHIVPALGDRPVSTLTGADFRHAIVELHTTAPREAEKLMAVCKTVFSTAFGRNRRITMATPWLDPTTVTDPMATAGTLERREAKNRHVEPDEVKRAYSAARQALGPICGDALRLQLLTATRISEVAVLPWSEIDIGAGTWKLPAGRAKNGTAHTIYLSTQALELLQARRDADPDAVWVFPSAMFPKEHMPSGTLSKAIAANREALGVDPEFRSHDGRHAFTTWCAENEIGREIRDRCTNHRPDAGKIDSVYNHAQLRTPAKTAWQRWADALADTKSAGNIVSLGARA